MIKIIRWAQELWVQFSELYEDYESVQTGLSLLLAGAKVCLAKIAGLVAGLALLTAVARRVLVQLGVCRPAAYSNIRTGSAGSTQSAALVCPHPKNELHIHKYHIDGNLQLFLGNVMTSEVFKHLRDEREAMRAAPSTYDQSVVLPFPDLQFSTAVDVPLADDDYADGTNGC